MPNPAGTNSPVAFDQFTREIPYGEKKVQGDLQRSVPLAGQGAAATPLNAPRTAQRAATRQPQPAQASAPTGIGSPPPEPEQPPSAADVWQQLASVPGAPPIVFDYAQRATA